MSDASGLSRRVRNKSDRRQRLYRASRALFAERGFGATTVDAIAESAGVSRGTFFNYFTSKRALATSLYELRMQSLAELVDGLLDRPLTTGERIRLMFGDVASTDDEEPGLLRAEIEIMDRDGSPAEERDARARRLNAQILRILRQGLEDSEVREDHPVEFLAHMVAAVYLAGIRQWTHDPGFDVRAQFARAGQLAAELVTPSA